VSSFNNAKSPHDAGFFSCGFLAKKFYTRDTEEIPAKKKARVQRAFFFLLRRWVKAG